MIQRIIEKADVKHPVDADKILKEIKNYDIVSFDIFDTLLKRNVKEPTDVFSYMEKKYQINGFREKRIEAEKAARKKKNGLEISLEDIYAEFGADYSDEEMETESELLIANAEVYPIFRKCIESKTVIIVSDMYLPENFIKEILKREQIVGYKKLYLSSVIGKTKSSGNLFEYVRNDVGLNKKIIHIGDSSKSDYIMARKSGIEAIHIPTHIVKQGFTLKENGIEEDIINSFLNNTRPTSENQYYRFGYEKFGMFLWGYSKWLHESVTKAGIKKIYFFSRDGLIMKKAFDLLFQDVETYYLEVSRRSLRVPILWMNYDLEHVLNMISPSKLIPLAIIFDGVGLDINNYAELIEEYGFNLKTSFDRKQILKDQKLSAMYARLGADIEKVSKAEYELLVGYIKQNNLSGKFAIVDIGWSGGMQRYLSETLDMLKIDHSIKGYYIGVADYYKRNIEVVPDLDLNGYLFDFSHDDHAIDKRSAFVGLFETLFLEQGGSVKNYWNDNGVIKANRLPYEYLENGKPTHEYQCVKEIQRGALDFIKKFGNKEIALSANILFEGLKQTGLEPKMKDIEMFADFRFFDEGETQYLAKPKSMIYYLTHVRELKNDFLLSRWKIGFMKRLFKLKLPYENLYKAMLKYK